MDVPPEVQAGIDAHRARYEALKAAGIQVAAALPPTPLNGVPLHAPAILRRETVPGGWYATALLRRGDRLRLVNRDGTGAAALLAWALHDPSERLNHADTLKIQWSTELRRGRVVFSDMGRVMLSLTEDTGAADGGGAHDALMGGSTAASTLAQYGPGPWRNTRDNFTLAALKLGLSRQDIGTCITLFAPVSVDDAGRFTWRDGVRRPGDFVELRADMDLRVALSTAPHPLDPAMPYAPGAIEVIRWRGSPAGAGDPCRTASPEARRGFGNTEAAL
ncbi:MAG: urea amidolyase associated protein UAAP1 [Janthinobacterium lividum]